MSRISFGICLLRPMVARTADGEEFSIALARVDDTEYGRLTQRRQHDEWRQDFAFAATALGETGQSIEAFAVIREPNNRFVDLPRNSITSAAVERALQDAEVLISGVGPASAVDRAHTALHAYLRDLCDRTGLPYAKDANVTALFSLLREQHPRLNMSSAHASEMTRIGRAMATILDTVGTLRNRASGAHPAPDLLLEEEAVLVINVVRSLTHYIAARTN